jgi:hypothetical protein
MTEHRTDILISRIVDKVETAAEWSEFRTLAAGEPSVWELLAEAQRDNERLQRLTQAATAIADDVDLPRSELARRTFALRRPFSSGLGWAVAAAILLAWITSGPFAPLGLGGHINGGATRGPGGTPPVQTGTMLTTDGAWDNYLSRGEAEGTLVGEIEPKVLLSSKELPDGQLELTFIRQVIERRTVPILMRPTYDEQGRMTPIVVRPSRRGSL